MITDHITSEDPAHHWRLLNVTGGKVLDLGCGYHNDESRDKDWSTPRYWYTQGALYVVGIDANAADVSRVQRSLPGTYVAELVSVEFVAEYMPQVTHIKSDCEGGEANLFEVPIADHIQGVSVECHSLELAGQCRDWIAAGGLRIIGEQPLHDHAHILVITGVR